MILFNTARSAEAPWIGDMAGTQPKGEQMSATEFSSLPYTLKNVIVPVMFDGNMRRRHHRSWFFEDEHGDAVTVNQERHVEEALSPFWGS